jgi:hypothetical protein
VVDLGVVHVGIWNVVVHLFVVDGTIERIAQWVVVDVLCPRSNSWIIVLRGVRLLLSLVRDIRTDNHIELVVITTISTLGKKESAQKTHLLGRKLSWELVSPSGEPKVSFICFDTKLSVTIQRTQNSLVQLPVAGTVVLVEIVLAGIALDHVLT